MTVYSSLQLKVNDLKAKVEQNSITPAYLGAILDDFISLIRKIDLTNTSPDVKQTLVEIIASVFAAKYYRFALGWGDGNDIHLKADDGNEVASVDDIARASGLNNAVSRISVAEKSIGSLDSGLNEVNRRLDLLINGNASDVIDSIREFEQFLEGITNEATLTGILKQLDDKIHADFANDMPVVNIGIVPVEPHRGGGSIGSSSYSRELYAAIKRAYDDDKGIIGMFQVSTGGGNYVNLHISGYKWRDDIQGMQFECAATDATATNIRLYFMRVSIQERFYDSSPLRRMDIPLTANAVFDLSKLIADLNGKMDGHYEDTDGVIEDLEPLALERAKYRVFVDQWNRACVDLAGNVWGRYNEETGFFELNGLTDITYEEALDIYRCTYSTQNPINDFHGIYAGKRFRTNLPLCRSTGGCNCANMFQEIAGLEVAVLPLSAHAYTHSVPVSLSGCFRYCSRLRVIYRPVDCSMIDTPQKMMAYWPASLEVVELSNVRVDVDFSACKNLTMASLRFLVDNASNTTAITVTVHPDVFAKLTDENNVEWHSVLTDAMARNITFATV